MATNELRVLSIRHYWWDGNVQTVPSLTPNQWRATKKLGCEHFNNFTKLPRAISESFIEIMQFNCWNVAKENCKTVMLTKRVKSANCLKTVYIEQPWIFCSRPNDVEQFAARLYYGTWPCRFLLLTLTITSISVAWTSPVHKDARNFWSAKASQRVNVLQLTSGL